MVQNQIGSQLSGQLIANLIQSAKQTQYLTDIDYLKNHQLRLLRGLTGAFGGGNCEEGAPYKGKKSALSHYLTAR